MATHTATMDICRSSELSPLFDHFCCLPYSRPPSFTPSFATSSPKASNLPFSFFHLPSFRPPVARHATIRLLREPADVPSQVMSTICVSHGHGSSEKARQQTYNAFLPRFVRILPRSYRLVEKRIRAWRDMKKRYA